MQSAFLLFCGNRVLFGCVKSLYVLSNVQRQTRRNRKGFNVFTEKALNSPRLARVLSKRFNFANAGIMTLRQFIELNASSARKKIGNHMHDYNRRYFNSLPDRKSQDAYELRLERPEYQFWYNGVFCIAIPKIVFDALQCPNK